MRVIVSFRYILEFSLHYRSKLWLTYRRGFNAIGGTGPTGDSGWGCMLRCGQMLLAQTLSMLNVDKGTLLRFVLPNFSD